MELPETKHDVISPLAGLSAAELQTMYGNTKDEEDPFSPRALPAPPPPSPPSPPPPATVKCSPLSAIMFVSALGMGSGITVLNKVTFQTNATGLSGVRRHYEKPFMATFVMFAAMTTVLPLHWIVSCWEAKQSKKQYRTETEREKHEMSPTKAKAGAGTAEGPRPDYHQDQHAQHQQQDEPPTKLKHPPRRQRTKTDVLALGVPALLDMCTVVCFWIGLTHISAHVFALLCSTGLIFTALIKRFGLRQKLRNHQWLGILLSTLAVILIASTSLFASHTTAQADAHDNAQSLGVMFVIVGNVFSAALNVVTEVLLDRMELPPLYVVGVQGVWGTLVMGLIIFPWVYLIPGSDAVPLSCAPLPCTPTGSVENPLDTIAMLRSNTDLCVVVGALFVLNIGWNLQLIYITKLLDAMWVAIMFNFIPAVVWMLDLSLYYATVDGTAAAADVVGAGGGVTRPNAIGSKSHPLGEKWTDFSVIELFGMLLLFFGTAVYKGIEVPQRCRKCSSAGNGAGAAVGVGVEVREGGDHGDRENHGDTHGGNGGATGDVESALGRVPVGQPGSTAFGGREANGARG